MQPRAVGHRRLSWFSAYFWQIPCSYYVSSMHSGAWAQPTLASIIMFSSPNPHHEPFIYCRICIPHPRAYVQTSLFIQYSFIKHTVGISCRSRLTTNIITSQPPLYALANGSAPINHHQETQDAQHHNVQPHADMQPSCNAHGAYKRGFCTVYIPYLVFSVKCV